MTPLQSWIIVGALILLVALVVVGIWFLAGVIDELKRAIDDE
jgi:flagellar biogenesis protein FliO